MPVYVTLVEVKPLKGCEVAPEEFAGAMTRGYAAADDIKLAIARFEEELASLRFEVVDMEWCGRAEAVDWDDEDAEAGSNLANDAKTSGRVVFGNFHAWEKDANGSTEPAAG